MQKSAHLGSLATRLNNLEQKFDESPGSGGDDEMYKLVLAGSELGGYAGGPTIYEQFSTSLFKSVFGLDTSGQPSFGALVSAQYNSFYSQVFGMSGGWFLDVGGGLNPDGDPAIALSDAVFNGVSPTALGGYSLAYLVTGVSGGYATALGLDTHVGRSLPDVIFSSPANAEAVVADYGSLYWYIKSLESRIRILELTT